MGQTFVVAFVAVDANEELLSATVGSEVGGQTGSKVSLQNEAHIQTDRHPRTDSSGVAAVAVSEYIVSVLFLLS